MFKQEVQAISLSLEQGTSSVPDDGRFHVVVDGDVVFSSRARSAALNRYRSIREELLLKAGLEKRQSDPEETRRREREFYDVQVVMFESMRQRTSPRDYFVDRPAVVSNAQPAKQPRTHGIPITHA
jgi:hypothetical protein